MGLGTEGVFFEGLDRTGGGSLHPAASVGMAVDRSAMIKAIGLVGVLGYLADSVLGLAGVLEFQGSGFVGHPLAPLWLWGLWLVFATTLGSLLSWLSCVLGWRQS